MALNHIWVDCETTGLDPEKAAVIQIAAIRKDGKTFQSYVRPHDGADISDEALRVNGRTRPQLQTYETPQLVGSKFIEFMKPQAPKIILAGHNVKFDYDFLKHFFRKAGIAEFEKMIHYQLLDTLPLAMALNEAGIMQTEKGWLRLQDLTKALGVLNTQAHDALGDIMATKACYEAMLTRLKSKSTQDGLQKTLL